MTAALERGARALLLLCIGAAGCGNCSKSESAGAPTGPSAKPPVEAPKEVARTATIEGVILLSEGAKLPEYTPEQMERKVLDHTERGPWPEVCTPPKIVDRNPMLVAEGNALSSVVIAVSDFTKSVTRPARTHEVSIRDCRLTPRMVVAMKGDTLRVKNEVNFPFMPVYGKVEALRTLMPGQTYDVPLDQGGVGAVLCGFTAPCGRSDVIVLQHPLATVSDDQGHFRIDGLPSGEPLTISGWHPLLDEATESVVLAPGETKRIELVARPVSREIPVVVEEEGAAPTAAEPEKPPSKQSTPLKPSQPSPKEPADG